MPKTIQAKSFIGQGLIIRKFTIYILKMLSCKSMKLQSYVKPVCTCFICLFVYLVTASGYILWQHICTQEVQSSRKIKAILNYNLIR